MKEWLEFRDVFHKIKEWKTENIRYLFFLLLCEKKVSFKELSESYVEAPFLTIRGFYKQCVSYNDETKYLIGTKKMPPKKYITWEE